jgi:ABC-type sugar transport system ATPase subunit
VTPTVPALRVSGLSKHFGGLVAVNDVSLEVYPGEVVGLLGDNGAGKSTLVKIISGVFRPDAGRIYLDEHETSFGTPMEARTEGIETIYQDLALCENLDAPANIFLGREPSKRVLGVLPAVDRQRMHSEAKDVLNRLDIRIPNLGRPMRQMSGGQRQAVAIARAVYWNARLMIMDEPTAALGVPEQRKVLQLVRTLRDAGVPVVMITHNMQDAFEVADRLLVMRRGRLVGELQPRTTTPSDVVGLMVGVADATG